MRKFVILLCVLSIILCFVGCGSSNYSAGVGNLNFSHIHFSDHLNGYCGTIEKWYENDTGIEVKTTEYGSIFLSEGTYIMFAHGLYCPYCK